MFSVYNNLKAKFIRSGNQNGAVRYRPDFSEVGKNAVSDVNNSSELQTEFQMCKHH